MEWCSLCTGPLVPLGDFGPGRVAYRCRNCAMICTRPGTMDDDLEGEQEEPCPVICGEDD